MQFKFVSLLLLLVLFGLVATERIVVVGSESQDSSLKGSAEVDSETTEELPIETQVMRLLQMLATSTRQKLLSGSTTNAVTAFQLK